MSAHLADLLHGEAVPAAPRVEEPGEPVTLFIVRHGATRLNNQTDMSEDRIRSWTDVPLVEEGRAEARRAALKLKGKGIHAIVASDLVRAKETAEIIGKIIGVMSEVSLKLRPWKLGKFTGAPTSKALPEIARYVRNKPDEPVPEGESFNQFKTRMFEGFADAVEAHREGLLIVSHHRDLQTIEAWDRAGQPPDHAIDLDVFLQKGEPPGAIRMLKTSLAALRGSGMKDYAAVNDQARDAMGKAAIDRDDGKFSHDEVQYGLAKPNGRKCGACKYFHGKDNCELVVAPIYPGGWCNKFRAKAGDVAETPRQEAAEQGPRGDMSDVMAHGRAIAGAKALHAVGHISERQRDKHISASQKAIGGGRKPFGAFVP